MQNLQNKILKAPVRPFTPTELLELESARLFDFLWIEDSWAKTQTEDVLEAIGDNLYRIIWGHDLVPFLGWFTLFSNLNHAIQVLRDAEGPLL